VELHVHVLVAFFSTIVQCAGGWVWELDLGVRFE